MEKVRTGQTYLYREDGFNSEVIDIRMKDKVRGDYLHRALQKALQRFPYMTSKLVEKAGEFYLEENHDISMSAVKTNKFRTLGSMSTGYHLIDVTFYDCSIKVAFHHGLCDGRGVKPFVETLMYYYCCLKYKKEFDAAGIRLAGEPLLEGETEEPIGTEFFEVNQENVIEIEKDGYELPECSSVTGFYRSEITVKQEDFMRIAKQNHATPAIMLAILISKSMAKLYPEAEKPIVCSMATDFRKYCGYEYTHRNTTGSCYLPYTKQDSEYSMKELSEKYRALLKAQKEPDVVKAALNMQIGLFNKLDAMESLEEKKKMMSFFDHICINTYVISYLGQMNFGEYNQYVESTHLYSEGAGGITFDMIASGDTFAIDLLQSFETDKYRNGLLQEFDALGLSYQATKLFEFETGKDKSHITSRHQAERYYK